MDKVSEILKKFQEQARLNTLHHAWIIESGTQTDRMELLEGMVLELLSEKAVKEKFHPNLIWVKESDPHGVDAVRSLVHFLEKSSWDGSWKVVVVTGADQLNSQAQNAFLKVLEEPTDKTVLILASQSSHQLLPTVYSRSGHYILNSKTVGIEALSTFETDWKTAIERILSAQDYEPLLRLQLEIDRSEVSVSEQIERLLGVVHAMIVSEESVILPKKLLIEKWSILSEYCRDVRKFNLDTKRLLMKLTHLLLNDQAVIY